VPLTHQAQVGLESFNYGLSLLGLLLVFIGYKLNTRRTRAHYQQILEGRA
jgi:hypothetical protein